MQNRFRHRLAESRFAITIEIVCPSRDLELATALAPALAVAHAVAADTRVAALSVTDRVRSDDDHDPVGAAVLLGRASGMMPVVHLSGKDRSRDDLARSLGGLHEAGIDTVLCVTGDRLKAWPGDRRVPYLDSVEAVAIARRLSPSALIGAGVSPFKYTEEETHTQYAKMARKHAAGADYLITQVGWDMAKLDELMRYRRLRGFAAPVLANVMALPVGAARRIHKGGVPGVVMTGDLLALVESEAQADDRGRARRFTRLALQLVGAERLGCAGAQVSGLSSVDDVRHVLDLVDEWRDRAPTPERWAAAWDACIRLPGGAQARLGHDDGYFLFGSGASQARAPRPAERRRYLALASLHHLVFHRLSPVFHALRPIARRIAPGSPVARRLAALEHAIKRPITGCELCGTCRLPDTFYVCPETCPKGLANGPCGGSTRNLCEAGDRECVHALVYRLARAAGRVDRLERGMIAGVPGPPGGSSWLQHFTDRSPTVERTHR